LSDSGLGCADWPNCNADNFISVDTGHSAIEQLNRIFSGLIGIPLGVALVFAYRRQPRRRDLISRAWLMLALFLGNAVLGGISVMVKLAWVSVMGHFLLAIALVGVALDTYKRAGEPQGPRAPIVPRSTVVVARLVYVLTAWVLVAGTLLTAAGPHGGDREAERLDWAIGDVARVHAVSVDVLVALVLVFVVALVRHGAPRPVLLTASAALAVMTAQGVLGYVQYFNAIPELLVGFHVVGAVLVFGTVQWLQLTLREPVRPEVGARELATLGSPLDAVH
jgi:cytochrome c oxidase assembly protein subunit 15